MQYSRGGHVKFQAHFLDVIAGVSRNFPLYLWDRLLVQTDITLKLLQQSNSMPVISAYAHMNGPFYYNKMPLATMGCGMQSQNEAYQRCTWSYHSVDG